MRRVRWQKPPRCRGWLEGRGADVGASRPLSCGHEGEKGEGGARAGKKRAVLGAGVAVVGGRKRDAGTGPLHRGAVIALGFTIGAVIAGKMAHARAQGGVGRGCR
jgi:hypothetical protein